MCVCVCTHTMAGEVAQTAQITRLEVCDSHRVTGSTQEAPPEMGMASLASPGPGHRGKGRSENSPGPSGAAG